MSKLFSRLQLGPLTLANRITVSPMCQYSAENGSATDWHLQHLCWLGYTGAAVAVVEATAVDAIGRITPGCLGLYSDENEVALARALNVAKKFSQNTIFGIQLAHAGRKGSTAVPWLGGKPLSKDEGAWLCDAPSSIPFDTNWPTPNELDENGMQRICDAFVRAAQRAIDIGFELIELHSAHGYLLHEFLSPLSNQRQDQYGGSLENRMRFPLALAEAVRKAVPSSMALGVRISATDWIDGGFTINEAIVYSKRLKQLGFDYITASSGGAKSHIHIPVGPGYQVPLAQAIRQEVGILTQAVGMITTAQQAEEIISKEQADLVAIARGFLDDPRWVWHAADSLKAEIKVPPQYSRSRPPSWQSPLTFSP